jgi:hypothetical protein
MPEMVSVIPEKAKVGEVEAHTNNDGNSYNDIYPSCNVLGSVSADTAHTTAETVVGIASKITGQLHERKKVLGGILLIGVTGLV